MLKVLAQIQSNGHGAPGVGYGAISRWMNPRMLQSLEPSRPLRILINIQNNPNAIAKGHGDPRFRALFILAAELTRRGHKVFAMCGWGGYCGRPCKARGDGFYEDPNTAAWGRELMSYESYAPDKPPVDLAIVWAHAHTCRGVSKRGQTTLGGPRALYFVYEHGLSHGTVTIDPRGLLTNSYYARRLNKAVQQYADEMGHEETERGCETSSKRPQGSQRDVPKQILGRFILVPTQKALDVSVMLHSNTTMENLMHAVIAFAKSRSIPVVFKVHPHLLNMNTGEGSRQEDLVRELSHTMRYTNVHVSRADIRWLMKTALFTVTINGGTLFDNFVTQTPVLAVGRSMLTFHDGVLHNPNVSRGLKQMLKKELPWPDWRRQRQRQVVCWVKRMSLNARPKLPSENVAVIQRHLDYVQREPQIVL